MEREIMSSHLPVLIIGAGPTGLMMACELARFGIPFRIVDKQAEPAKFSSAAWIQTRTLEIFDHIGIIDRFLQCGKRCEILNMFVDGKPVTNIPLQTIDSVFPFVLIMPPNETQRILQKRLDELRVRVERQVEVIDIKTRKKTPEAILRDARGKIEKVSCTWIIACDGSSSPVRDRFNLHFSRREANGKLLRTMRDGQVFLAGDAVNPGRGNQNINNGLQDAYNLAWKLALVVNNKAKVTLLESYGKERQHAMRASLTEGMQFSDLSVGDKTYLANLAPADRIAFYQDPNLKRMCEQLTQLSIQYKYSSIIDYSVKLNSMAPRQGARLPDVNLQDNKNLYEHLRNTHHNILVFLSKITTQNLSKVVEIQDWAHKEFAHMIRVHVISREKISDIDNLIHDPKGWAQQRLNIDGTAVFITRPDTYIAYASHNLALNPIKKLIAKYAKNG
jgi:hypothetical protein